MVATIDLAANLAALTGFQLPADACFDSFAVSDTPLSRPGAKGRGHVLT
jgi:hypothetical protein